MASSAMPSAWCTCCSTIKQRRTRVADRSERAVDLVDDDRREPERELVGDQQPRPFDHARAPARACAARHPRACPRPGGAAPPAGGTARRPARARPALRARRELRPNVRSRFSSTVSDANTERPSGACTMPRRANLNGFSPVTSSPSKHTEPAVGSISPRAHTRRSSSCPRRSSRAARGPSPACNANDTPKSARNGP